MEQDAKAVKDSVPLSWQHPCICLASFLPLARFNAPAERCKVKDRIPGASTCCRSAVAPNPALSQSQKEAQCWGMSNEQSPGQGVRQEAGNGESPSDHAGVMQRKYLSRKEGLRTGIPVTRASRHSVRRSPPFLAMTASAVSSSCRGHRVMACRWCTNAQVRADTGESFEGEKPQMLLGMGQILTWPCGMLSRTVPSCSAMSLINALRSLHASKPLSSSLLPATHHHLRTALLDPYCTLPGYMCLDPTCKALAAAAKNLFEHTTTDLKQQYLQARHCIQVSSQPSLSAAAMLGCASWHARC